jgi:hypothetical protein
MAVRAWLTAADATPTASGLKRGRQFRAGGFFVAKIVPIIDGSRGETLYD